MYYVPLDDIYRMQGRALKQFADQGRCRGTDTSFFYPGRPGEIGGWNREDAGKVAHAKSLCAECPVQAECLAYAIKFDEAFGIWGGLTSRERSKLMRRHPWFTGLSRPGRGG